MADLDSLTPPAGRHCRMPDQVPDQWPTLHLDDHFWEALGRAVATFGELELALARAISVFSAPIREERPGTAREIERWILNSGYDLTKTLAALKKAYIEQIGNEDHVSKDHLRFLDAELEKAVMWRNVFTHASWPEPVGEGGGTKPIFVRKDKTKTGLQVFHDIITADNIANVQHRTAQLIIDIINTVTEAGYNFPGDPHGPGVDIWPKGKSQPTQPMTRVRP